MNNRLNIFKRPLISLFLLTIALAFSSTKISYSSHNQMPAEKSMRFKPVIDKLLSQGADSNFVFQLISSSNVAFNERYVKINVTGYLTPTDYTQFHNDLSVAKTKDFLQKYDKQLSAAEERFGVPKHVIASVLWIETRHGSFLGNHNIASVYLSTALSYLPEFIELNIREMDVKFSGSKSEREKLVERIKSRAQRKSDWAITQLFALEKISNKIATPIDSIYGSWAGAFGISQFIPSSFVAWAYDGNNDGVINLFDFDDAIFSVGNYLKSNGWGKSNEEQRKAVFHYNNSNKYVDAVLKLAELAAK